jgi:ankyrin repeat protein
MLCALVLAALLVAGAAAKGTSRGLSSGPHHNRHDDRWRAARVAPFQQSSTSAAQSTRAGNDSAASALVEAVYQASRQDDEKASMQHLERATSLLSQGADVRARGGQGRTALHWAVLGAAAARHEKHVQAYMDLAELLLARGADANAEDDFGNTPLDYEVVSSNNRLLNLLLEHDARSGSGQDEARILARVLAEVSSVARAGDLRQIRETLSFDLPVGAELPIRLTDRVGSRSSRSGDTISAVVIAPVTVNDRVVIAPGTRIEGTVLLAQGASDDYHRAQLILDFANLVHPGGDRTRLVTQVAEVDNARETVQAGRIIGIAHPNTTKLTWGMRALGMADPALSYALQAAFFARDKEYKREIDYGPGVEMLLTVTAPAKVREPAAAAGWPMIPISEPLISLVRAQPLRTETPDGTPSDLTNIMLIGSQPKIEAAFRAAGWAEAEKLELSSGLKSFAAVAEQKGYKSAPVSLLLLGGQKPGLVFQKQNNTLAKRHHLRIWKQPARYQGQEVWVAAATHDISIVRRGDVHWTHGIDSHIDRERAKVASDLLFTGLVKGYALIERPAAPSESENATGDKLITDKKVLVLALK